MKTAQGNRMGRSVVIEGKAAALSTDFGMKMLRAKFPDEADAILAHLGVYSRGPRKGLPRGYIHWDKIVEGGFHYGEGRVLYPGTRGWRVMPDTNPEGTSVGNTIALAAEAAKRNEEK